MKKYCEVLGCKNKAVRMVGVILMCRKCAENPYRDSLIKKCPYSKKELKLAKKLKDKISSELYTEMWKEFFK